MSNSGGQKPWRFHFLILLLMALTVLIVPQTLPAQANKTPTTGPWGKTQLMTPEELVKLLAGSGGAKPLVVYVGFEFLYKGAHIPGARFIGTGREAKGIDALKRWAGSIPHDRDVVIYCGCCPFKQCPNIRPAFQTLREAGLTHLKVLEIDDSFVKGWVQKGYPVEKGTEQKPGSLSTVLVPWTSRS